MSNNIAQPCPLPFTMAPMKARKAMKAMKAKKTMKALKRPTREQKLKQKLKREQKAEQELTKKKEKEQEEHLKDLREARAEETTAWDEKQQATIDAEKMAVYKIQKDLAYRKKVENTKDIYHNMPKNVQKKCPLFSRAEDVVEVKKTSWYK